MGEARYGIGELARLVGLPVRTIRFYSDAGLLPPAERTLAGYRRYSDGDRARLELIRTLRDLGMDLPTIRRVLQRQVSLDGALRAQLEALDAQLRALRTARAVLRAALARGAGGRDLDRLRALARLGAAERSRLIERFFDAVVEGVPVDQEWFADFRRAGLPDLPEDPTDGQLDAWLELATLVTDGDFQRRMREQGRSFWKEAGCFDAGRWRAAIASTMAQATAAEAAGIAPTDPSARPVVEAIARTYAELMGREADAAFCAELLALWEEGYDPRAERYWELVSIINGQACQQRQGGAWRWLLAAFRHAAGSQLSTTA